MTGSDLPLRLFLDRSTQGRRFVAAVRELVDDVETINDRYGTKRAEKVPDVRWITDASADGRILVGADRNIVRNPLERSAVCAAAARYVVFSNNNIPMREMIERFRHHLPRIRRLAGTAGPWVYQIAKHGMERLTLRCGDTGQRPRQGVIPAGRRGAGNRQA